MQRTKRLIAVMGAAALLAATGVGVAAQEEEADRSTPVYVTWESGEPTSVTDGVFYEDAGELRGLGLDDIPLEASDPRLSGVAYVAVDGNAEYSADIGAILTNPRLRHPR